VWSKLLHYIRCATLTYISHWAVWLCSVNCSLTWYICCLLFRTLSLQKATSMYTFVYSLIQNDSTDQKSYLCILSWQAKTFHILNTFLGCPLALYSYNTWQSASSLSSKYPNHLNPPFLISKQVSSNNSQSCAFCLPAGLRAAQPWQYCIYSVVQKWVFRPIWEKLTILAIFGAVSPHF